MEIRGKIAEIRAAILARSAEGIVRFGTADWTFVSPDGTRYNRGAYLERTKALFASLGAVHSLDTDVDRVAVEGAVADVDLTQTMVRTEKSAEGERRFRLVYHERQLWRHTAAGWCVQEVRIDGNVERQPVPAN